RPAKSLCGTLRGSAVRQEVGKGRSPTRRPARLQRTKGSLRRMRRRHKFQARGVARRPHTVPLLCRGAVLYSGILRLARARILLIQRQIEGQDMVGRRVATSLLLGMATILGWSTSGTCNNSV